MGIVHQGWRNARVAVSGAGLIHTFLPDDPDLAHLALIHQLQRFAAKHEAATSGYDHARIADMAAEEGFSHHPTHGKAPSSGWMASYETPEGSDVGQVHKIHDISADHIAAHRQAIAHHLSEPNSYQGAWHDTSTGDVYLDASRHFHDEHECKHFAVREKQKAVFHLGDFTERFIDPHQDPLREKDHDEWKNRYGGQTSPHPGWKGYAHLYPDTDEQAAARSQHTSKAHSAMAGRVAHPGQSAGWVDRLRARKGF